MGHLICAGSGMVTRILSVGRGGQASATLDGIWLAKMHAAVNPPRSTFRFMEVLDRLILEEGAARMPRADARYHVEAVEAPGRARSKPGGSSGRPETSPVRVTAPAVEGLKTAPFDAMTSERDGP
jgi:hypothetical protein